LSKAPAPSAAPAPPAVNGTPSLSFPVCTGTSSLSHGGGLRTGAVAVGVCGADRDAVPAALTTLPFPAKPAPGTRHCSPAGPPVHAAGGPEVVTTTPSSCGAGGVSQSTAPFPPFPSPPRAPRAMPNALRQMGERAGAAPRGDSDDRLRGAAQSAAATASFLNPTPASEAAAASVPGIVTTAPTTGGAAASAAADVPMAGIAGGITGVPAAVTTTPATIRLPVPSVASSINLPTSEAKAQGGGSSLVFRRYNFSKFTRSLWAGGGCGGKGGALVENRIPWVKVVAQAQAAHVLTGRVHHL